MKILFRGRRGCVMLIALICVSVLFIGTLGAGIPYILHIKALYDEGKSITSELRKYLYITIRRLGGKVELNRCELNELMNDRTIDIMIKAITHHKFVLYIVDKFGDQFDFLLKSPQTYEGLNDYYGDIITTPSLEED